MCWQRRECPRGHSSFSARVASSSAYLFPFGMGQCGNAAMRQCGNAAMIGLLQLMVKLHYRDSEIALSSFRVSVGTAQQSKLCSAIREATDRRNHVRRAQGSGASPIFRKLSRVGGAASPRGFPTLSDWERLCSRGAPGIGGNRACLASHRPRKTSQPILRGSRCQRLAKIYGACSSLPRKALRDDGNNPNHAKLC